MPQLVILGAAYGPADVTSKVRSLVCDHGLTVTADNETFGDTWPGNRKSLVIVYQYDQLEPRVLAVREREGAIILPDMPPAGPSWLPYPDGKLTILGAAYGPADVTAELRRMVTNETLTIRGDSDLLPDTWVGVAKTLVVVYQYHGVPRLWTAKQNEGLSIADGAVPDESAPISRAIVDRLGGENGPLARKTYDFTTGNAVTLFQTPETWGSNLSPSGPTKASEAFASALGEAVAQANHWVDITTLWPLPSGKFFEALHDAIVTLARRKAAVTVRILAGKPPAGFPGLVDAAVDPVPEATQWLGALSAGLPADCAINIYLAVQTGLLTWNHAKILAVDGQTAFVGGHNMWHDDYMSLFPVHDISARARGRAALSTHLFADQLWGNVEQLVAHAAPKQRTWTWCWSGGEILRPVMYPGIIWRDIAAPNTAGNSRILTLGNLADGMCDSSTPGYNASSTALAVAISHAEHSVKLSQQNLYFLTHGNEAVISALAQRILTRRVQVDVVMTDDAALRYSTHAGIELTYSRLFEAIQQLDPDFQLSTLKEVLHIAPLRVANKEDADSGQWVYWDADKQEKRTKPFANHAKLCIVDDKAFYVGSHNLYPCDLQEIGFFIEDEAQTQVLLTEYWHKLWSYSQQWL
jgi:phosphatidylserine/phosphatidylglycerophosphate/cardiolipin synthase-like enzyme